ncbi:MAG: undecaprenyl-phosphate glucose phosphotransferase [Actinomycetota bacterium]|nr:undecaprenyl-phosphate glucose phosphotransferase [Actinomycetota bacterium]
MPKPSQIYKPKKPLIWTIVLLLSDTLMIVSGFWFAYYLRFVSDLLPLKHPTPYAVQMHATIIFRLIPFWLLIFFFYRLYDWRYLWRVSGEAARVVNAVTLSILAVMVGTFLGKDTAMSRGWLFISWLSCIFLVIAGRLIVRSVVNWYHRRGVYVTRMLIVGANEEGKNIAEQIQRFPALGLKVIGFTDDKEPKGEEVLPGLAVLGGTKDLPSLVSEGDIDLLLLVSTALSHQRLAEIVQSLDEVEVDIQMSAGLFEMVTSRIAVRDIGGIPILQLSKVRLKGLNLVIKAIFDYVLATLGLIILSPLLLIIAILVKLTSSGPIFYLQPRVGQDGGVFNMYKFRTMVADAERETGPVWASKGDPRRTPLGRFLRKYSLDELPQLFNVLKGEMSLVGPRPERPVFVKEFNQSVPRYTARHRIKVGMTGWAQVNGLRGNTPLEERVKFDNFYIENWSLLLDIEILIRTFFRIFTEKQAY